MKKVKRIVGVIEDTRRTWGLIVGPAIVVVGLVLGLVFHLMWPAVVCLPLGVVVAVVTQLPPPTV